MVFLYRIFTELTAALLPALSFLFKKGKLKDFSLAQKQGIVNAISPKKGLRYWFHCASLGEFEQARPLMEALIKENPENSLVITFFSPSGYSQKSDYALADKVLYLPIDTPSNAKKLQDYLQADAAVFIKYEIWYFHLNELFKRKIPVYLVSAVFREKQFIFSFFGSWLFKLLPQFKQIFVQDQASLLRLQRKGLKNISLSGDTRYDRVKANALQVVDNPQIKSFKGQDRLIVIGSSWQEEENIIKEWLVHNKSTDFKIMLAPHDISSEHIDEIKHLFAGEKVQRYTEYNPESEARILILDTMGHLASAYVYADLAFIGGGFGKGLHNILEALAFGVPVVFGPHTAKHPEAALAISAKVARPIKDAAEFADALRYYFEENSIDAVKLQCTDFIHVHSGATDLVLKAIHLDAMEHE